MTVFSSLFITPFTRTSTTDQCARLLKQPKKAAEAWKTEWQPAPGGAAANPHRTRPRYVLTDRSGPDSEGISVRTGEDKNNLYSVHVSERSPFAFTLYFVSFTSELCPPQSRTHVPRASAVQADVDRPSCWLDLLFDAKEDVISRNTAEKEDELLSHFGLQISSGRAHHYFNNELD